MKLNRRALREWTEGQEQIPLGMEACIRRFWQTAMDFTYQTILPDFTSSQQITSLDERQQVTGRSVDQTDLMELDSVQGRRIHNTRV